MKYRLGWTMTVYFEAEVEAESEEAARELFAEGGLDDAYRTGDAGDAELTYVEVVKEN